jgi:predicted MFS family arabinose efflux permease
MVAVQRFGKPRLNKDRRPLLPAQIWLVHLALAMGGFGIGTAMSLLPYFAHDLRITEPAAGHVISAYACGVLVGAPVIALLAAK